MAEATLRGRAAALFPPRGGLIVSVLEHREVVALAGLMVAAAVLRLYDLGDRALHHDESLHAFFSYQFSQGDGYRHDPLMHGPFQFMMGGLAFFLLQATDYTARVAPALFGTALVGMPYLLRRQIGMRAVLIAAVLLCFSPTLLYFSRFDREDIFTAFWTFAILIAVWRYLDEHKPLYLYALAGALAFGYATKELTFMTAAILLVFADLALALELGRRREDEAQLDDSAVAARTLTLVPVAWLIAIGWPLIGGRPFGRDRLPPVGDVLVVVGTLSAPLFAPALQIVLPALGFDGLRNQGYAVAAEDSLRTWSVVLLLLGSIYVGLIWRPREWPIIAACFYVPFILLFTTFFTNTPSPLTGAFWNGDGGFWSGIWGSLDYWIEQQDVRRGNQPGYYYALVTPLYEFLPLLIALGGVAWLALRGQLARASFLLPFAAVVLLYALLEASGTSASFVKAHVMLPVAVGLGLLVHFAYRGQGIEPFRGLLLLWLAGIFIGLTIAGEKMPWLESHLALPLILLAAISLDRAVGALDFQVDGRRLQNLLVLAALAFGGVILVVEGRGSSATALIGWVLLGGSLGYVLFAWAEGWRALGRAALTALLAVLFGLTLRAGLTASFEHGDVPVELLVYTQTSPDLPLVMERIDAVAAETGLKKSLPIVVDTVDGFTWPWAWYLRDYDDVNYAGDIENLAPDENAVLLIGQGNAHLIDAARYDQQPYKHRWWFPETYRELTLSKVASIATDPDELSALGRFFLDRRAPPTDSSVDGVAFFPTGEAPLPPPPVVLADGRTIVGERGRSPGYLNQPTGIWIDAELNLWVADSGNDRIEKFDQQGNFLLALDGSDTPAGRFTEPWAVAIDWDGTVYVIDTWAHQIHKFAPDLTYLKSWGEGASVENPTPYQLFGPRDVTFDAFGNIWVNDTGNKRLILYSSEGEALATYGAAGAEPGQLDEAVGFRLDGDGNFYIADTWNGRIQVLDSDFQPVAQYPATWTSQDALAKPYLTIIGGGRIVVTDPGNRALLLYTLDGEPLGTWRPGPEVFPVGVVAMPGGGFAFSDAESGQVQLIPASLVDSLFQR